MKRIRAIPENNIGVFSVTRPSPTGWEVHYNFAWFSAPFDFTTFVTSSHFITFLLHLYFITSSHFITHFITFHHISSHCFCTFITSSHFSTSSHFIIFFCTSSSLHHISSLHHFTTSSHFITSSLHHFIIFHTKLFKFEKSSHYIIFRTSTKILTIFLKRI